MLASPLVSQAIRLQSTPITACVATTRHGEIEGSFFRSSCACSRVRGLKEIASTSSSQLAAPAHVGLSAPFDGSGLAQFLTSLLMACFRNESTRIFGVACSKASELYVKARVCLGARTAGNAPPCARTNVLARFQRRRVRRVWRSWPANPASRRAIAARNRPRAARPAQLAGACCKHW